MTRKHNSAQLEHFAATLLQAGGMDGAKAGTTARLLVRADMMGHDTHGLQLLPSYLASLARGDMTADGDPELLFDAPAAATWDGRYLPGLWLVDKAIHDAAHRAAMFGQASIAIRRSGHIGCLAAFLPDATARGLVALIASSDPCGGYVAPHGGRTPLLSPNPIAMGIPTSGDPILIDISASTTTVGMTRRMAAEGRLAHEPWYVDPGGEISNDPAVAATTATGAILPVGGAVHGHKGFGLALMIETLTQGLPGFGRADSPNVLGAAVFVQLFDPRLFGGLEAFTRQVDWLATACRDSQPRNGFDYVRMPGDLAHTRMRKAAAEGLALHPAIMPALEAEAKKMGVAVPIAQ